ncbi:thioesterase-like superfamily-domain-containing protein [Aspergillus foveolatus]|uniref:thioesterase-like superfamily-domain-containing protein n=1 Tax=Aspergillus foveolatus TaxID=210207 RepID=UPI003CCDB7A6
MSSNLPLDVARTLAEHISVETVVPETFQARFKPERQGNTASYSYGGCALGVGVQAACRAAPVGYNLYSVTGSFLAPVLTDSKITCSKSCLTPQEIGQKKVEQGTISNESLSLYNTLFGLIARFFEAPQALEGISAHNLHGMAKEQPQPPHQALLPLTAKTSADWFRCRAPLSTRSDHYAALAWMLDAYLTFTPLAHSGMFFDDAAACATLDFAIRFFCDEFDLCDWLLREIKTIVGGEGRSYTEGRVWNERGRLVASMSQQSILRPKVMKRGGKAMLEMQDV